MNTPKPLTELTIPELERLIREKQGEPLSCVHCDGRHWCDDENWQGEYGQERVEADGRIPCSCTGFNWNEDDVERDEFTNNLTDTEWLDLLNGLPLYIAISEVLNSEMLEIEFGLTLSEALKRATLIAYLEHD